MPGKVIELPPAGSARHERQRKQVATLVEDRLSRLISGVSTEQLLALLAFIETWEEMEAATLAKPLPLSVPQRERAGEGAYPVAHSQTLTRDRSPEYCPYPAFRGKS